ncbi:MAG: Crp/Fnr family transcriptional regulator [Rhizobacter sp.]
MTAIKSESEGRTAWLDTNGSHGVTQRCAPFSWRCRALPSMAAKRDKAVAHFVPPATDPTARGTDMLDMAITRPASPLPTSFGPILGRAPIKSAVAARSETARRLRGGQGIAETLELLGRSVVPQRRVVHAGDVIYQVGEPFVNLCILNSGFVKIVNLSADGREQVVGIKFRGDWLGFDGIAGGEYSCDAVAMDTGELWTIPYASLLGACASNPTLLTMLHEAMSREIARDRDSLMSVCTLPADARVAEFLRYWADSLAQRGLRTDQITLRMTRAEIGNYLGMTLESVSRALSKLARLNVIAFAGKGRREVEIPDVAALSAFMQGCLAPAPTLQ